MSKIRKDLPVSSDWEESTMFYCKACKGMSRIHPDTSYIWGCLKCGFTTASVTAYFSPLRGNPLFKMLLDNLKDAQ